MPVGKISTKLYYVTFCNTFKVTFLVSGTKTMFSFFQNRLTWMLQFWLLYVSQHFRNELWVVLKRLVIYRIWKQRTKLSNHAISACFSKLFCPKLCFIGFWHPKCSATEQVYYTRKAIHMGWLWCKCQHVLVYKSFTMVKQFWSHNMALFKKLCILIFF